MTGLLQWDTWSSAAGRDTRRGAERISFELECSPPPLRMAMALPDGCTDRFDPGQRDRVWRIAQELGRVLPRIAGAATLARLARWPINWIAAELILHLRDVEEDIGLAAQLVGRHRWL